MYLKLGQNVYSNLTAFTFAIEWKISRFIQIKIIVSNREQEVRWVDIHDKCCITCGIILKSAQAVLPRFKNKNSKIIICNVLHFIIFERWIPIIKYGQWQNLFCFTRPVCNPFLCESYSKFDLVRMLQAFRRKISVTFSILLQLKESVIRVTHFKL